MARRKKVHHKRTHRRKRHHSMNGVSMSSLTPMLTIVAEGVAGAVGASFLEHKLLANFMPDKPTLKPLLMLGGSVIVGMTIKNTHVKNLAMGAATYSGLALAKTAIPGIGELMIGDIDGMMENLMIGATNTENLMIGETSLEDNVIEELVVADEVY
jgi:hypothetical protein